MFKKIIELYKYRTLIQTLVERDLNARYRGSLLGLLWSFINPLLLVLVYFVAFKICLRSTVENYTAFLFVGILPWSWFSSSVLEGANSILNGGHYLKKILFPSEILPLVSILSNFIHFLFGLPILMLVVGAAGITINGIHFLTYFPLIMIVQFLFTLSLVMLFAALTVHFRDMIHLLMNAITLWFFSTPIIYAAKDAPPFLVTYNPMAYIIIAYQDIFFDSKTPSLVDLGYTALFSFILLIITYTIYNRLRDSFVEEV
jgi:lipopolysaccharide transport system permease protein